MTAQHEKHQGKISLDEFFVLVESDPEHRYELIEGSPCLRPVGSPDHSIIGANITGIFREALRKRPCITYNSDVYVELSGEENCFSPDASVSCDRRDRHATKVIRLSLCGC